ncbi:MAG: phosphatase PAP2 family protein [Gammaproteobacteria bacterium]
MPVLVRRERLMRKDRFGAREKRKCASREAVVDEVVKPMNVADSLLGFLYQLPKNVIRCFKGYNFFWQFLAIVLTYIIVRSDFDWYYLNLTHILGLRPFLFPAVWLGMILPVVVPLILLAIGALEKDLNIKNTAFAMGQAAILGLAISSVYKAFTGRLPPPRLSSHGVLADTSHGFQFGFLRGGLFWGWPSSHTTVAFAMAVAVWQLYPESKIIRYTAVLLALYVGIGVSITIHWFSEFVAGAIIGSVIGAVVGKSFCRRISGKEVER